MEEVKKEKLEKKLEQEDTEKKVQDKKNTFTLIYILIGIFIIAVLAMLIYAFFVTK